MPGNDGVWHARLQSFRPSATDVSFRYPARLGAVKRLEDMLFFDVEALDIVQVAIICFRNNRQAAPAVSVERPEPRLLRLRSICLSNAWCAGRCRLGFDLCASASDKCKNE
jgi:hypothetical protein